MESFPIIILLLFGNMCTYLVAANIKGNISRQNGFASLENFVETLFYVKKRVYFFIASNFSGVQKHCLQREYNFLQYKIITKLTELKV